MTNLSLFLLQKTLLKIYKYFVRPNFDYGDIIYGKPFNESFKAKIEMIQYREALVITEAIKGTSRDCLYKEIGLESVAYRRWSRKIFFFHKIVNELLPPYLQSYLNYCNGKAIIWTNVTSTRLSGSLCRLSILTVIVL